MLDLHTHSTFSDGTLSPEEIYKEAAGLGLSGVALTDHDTVQGAIEFAKTLSTQDQNLCRLIVGVEISSQWKEQSVHILAYGCNWQQLEGFFLEQIQRRKDRMQAFLDKLYQKKSIDISMQQLIEFSDRPSSNLETQMIGRLHLAKLLVHLGKVKDLGEAFGSYIGKGAIAYVPSSYPAPYTVIEMIHRAGGIAVLAHPQLLPKKLLRREILSYNWDGIEAIYGLSGRFCPQPYVDLAKKHRLIVTAGSDFHAKAPYAPQIGASTLQGELMRLFLERLDQTATGAVSVIH